MVLQVRAFVTKPDNPSLIPEAHMVDERPIPISCSLTATCVMTRDHVYMHTPSQSKSINEKEKKKTFSSLNFYKPRSLWAEVCPSKFFISKPKLSMWPYMDTVLFGKEINRGKWSHKGKALIQRDWCLIRGTDTRDIHSRTQREGGHLLGMEGDPRRSQTDDILILD